MRGAATKPAKTTTLVKRVPATKAEREAGATQGRTIVTQKVGNQFARSQTLPTSLRGVQAAARQAVQAEPAVEQALDLHSPENAFDIIHVRHLVHSSETLVDPLYAHPAFAQVRSHEQALRALLMAYPSLGEPRTLVVTRDIHIQNVVCIVSSSQVNLRDQVTGSGTDSFRPMDVFGPSNSPQYEVELTLIVKRH